MPLYINKKSESLKLIQHARNEAHRFAINFHRDLRSKSMTSTELTLIPGVGKVSAQRLLSAFGSVKKVSAASVTELSDHVSPSIALKVFDYFRKPS